MVVLFGYIAAFLKILQEVSGKERMTFGLVMYQHRKLSGKVIGRESSVQINRNMFVAERVQSNLFAEIMCQHLGPVTLQRVIAALDIFRPESARDQKSLSADALAEMSQQVDAGR